MIDEHAVAEVMAKLDRQAGVQRASDLLSSQNPALAAAASTVVSAPTAEELQVIDAFSTPRFVYHTDRKQFLR